MTDATHESPSKDLCPMCVGKGEHDLKPPKYPDGLFAYYQTYFAAANTEFEKDLSRFAAKGYKILSTLTANPGMTVTRDGQTSPVVLIFILEWRWF